MIAVQQIETLIAEKIADSETFLVEVRVTSDNHIMVDLDNNNGVAITECISVSRHIESSLDREVQDFKLEVSSAGLDKPFRVLQQYIKNIGRQITVVTKESKNLKGTLLAANETEIELEQVKKIKKSKQEEKIIHRIKQVDIIKAKVVISF